MKKSYTVIRPWGRNKLGDRVTLSYNEARVMHALKRINLSEGTELAKVISSSPNNKAVVPTVTVQAPVVNPAPAPQTPPLPVSPAAVDSKVTPPLPKTPDDKTTTDSGQSSPRPKLGKRTGSNKASSE